MGNPRKSWLELSYNGINASENFSAKTEAFSYVDMASGEADTLSVTVNNQNGQWLNRFMPEDGDYIEAKIVVENWDRDGDTRSLKCGKFDLDSFVAAGFPETASIKGITIPIHTDFNTTIRNRTFSNMTVKTILAGICENAGIALVYESEDYNVEELEQSGETDMNFAFSLCRNHNLAMKLYNSKMVVYNQTDYERKPAAYTVDKEEMQNYSYNRGKSKLYDSVQIQYADPESDETLTYSYTVPGGGGKKTLFINEQANSYREAEVKAKARLLENIRGATSISFRLKGDPRHMSARNVNVTGLGNASGIYFIDCVTHAKNAKGVYTCTVKAHKSVIHTDFSDAAPAADQTSAGGTMYTVVKGDNLWNIARKFYGKKNGAKYKLIYNANRDLIKNKDLIYPGQVFYIPPA